MKENLVALPLFKARLCNIADHGEQAGAGVGGVVLFLNKISSLFQPVTNDSFAYIAGRFSFILVS